MRTIASLAIILALAGCNGANSSSFDGTSYAEEPANATASDDVDALEATLESAHPNLFFRLSRQAFEHAIGKAKRQIGPQTTATEAFLLLAPIVSSIGDAHTSLSSLTRDYVSYRDRGGLLFPLELRRASGIARVTADYSLERVPLGSSIESINGRPIGEIFSTFARLESGETAAFREWNASEDFRELAFATGLVPPFDVALRHGRSLTSMRLAGCTIDAIHQWDQSSAGRKALDPYSLSISRTSSIAVLTVRSFDADDDADWTSFLNKMKRRLRATAVHVLVIDVRENSGGSTEMSDELMAAFASRPYRDFSRIAVKVSGYVKRSLSPDEYQRRYGEDAWDASDGSVLSEHSDYTDPETVSDRFSGKVYVLTGTGTFSTAAIFAAAVQDSRNGVVWGSETGGYPTLYGEVHAFTLTHFDLTAGVSTKFFIRPNGSGRATGVIPDERFPETPQGEGDTELQSIIARIARSSRD